MKFPGKIPNRILLLILTMLFILASLGTVQARDRAWYFGGGYLLGTASGELNNSNEFFPSDDTVNGPIVNKFEVGEGSGFVINAGFAINRWVAIELMQVHIGLDATSTKFPDELLEANMDGFVLAIRPMVPMGPFEVFARVGFGGYNLEVQEIVDVTPNPNRKDANFSGSGYAYGGGIALTLGRLGIEASVTTHQVFFDSVEADGVSGVISNQELTFKTAMVILTIHFGKGLIKKSVKKEAEK